MSQRHEPGGPNLDQDPDAASSDRPQDVEAARRRRLDALHTLAEQALRSPSVVETKREVAQPENRVTTRPRRMPTAWRGSRRRRRRRRRVWRLGLVLLVLLVLVGGSLTVALHALRLGAPPSTSERSVASVSAIYFDPDVPWTTVSVDHRSVPLGKPGEQAPFLLPAGHHIISWEAAPFPSQECVLSSPATPTDTCPAAFEGIAYIPGEPAAEIVRLGEEADGLPQATFGSLASSIQAAIDASAQASTVHPGEPVFLPGPAVADGTYTATTRIQLDSQGSSRPLCQLDLLSAARDCNLVSTQCLPLCSLDYGERQSLAAALPSDEWLAIAAVSMWRDYASTAGEPAYPQQVLSSGATVFDDQAVLVGLQWQSGGWRVQLYLGAHLLAPSVADDQQRILVDPACATAEAYFAGDLTSTERDAYSQVRFVSGANPSAGCLIQATSAAGGGEQVEYFERFGVLLAVNRAAHQLHPSVPVAGPYVQQLAGQLASKVTPALAIRFPADSAP